MLIHLLHVQELTITDSGLVTRHVRNGLFRKILRFLLEKVNEFIKHALGFNVFYFFFLFRFFQVWLRQAQQLVDVLLQPFFISQQLWNVDVLVPDLSQMLIPAGATTQVLVLAYSLLLSVKLLPSLLLL